MDLHLYHDFHCTLIVFAPSLQETGDLIWEYNIKDPITSSAYADENLHLVSDPSHLSER